MVDREGCIDCCRRYHYVHFIKNVVYLYVMCNKPVWNMALGVDWFTNFISAGRRDSHSVNCRCSASLDIPSVSGCRGRYCVDTIARTILSATFSHSGRKPYVNGPTWPFQSDTERALGVVLQIWRCRLHHSHLRYPSARAWQHRNPHHGSWTVTLTLPNFVDRGSTLSVFIPRNMKTHT